MNNNVAVLITNTLVQTVLLQTVLLQTVIDILAASTYTKILEIINSFLYSTFSYNFTLLAMVATKS